MALILLLQNLNRTLQKVVFAIILVIYLRQVLAADLVIRIPGDLSQQVRFFFMDNTIVTCISIVLNTRMDTIVSTIIHPKDYLSQTQPLGQQLFEML